MLKRIFFIFVSLLLVAVVSGRAEERDTLFTAARANEIIILSNRAIVSVTVKDVDGNGENYYYQTSVAATEVGITTTMSTDKDVSEISVTEIDNRNVEIYFIAAGGNPMLFSFPIPDPANREVESYRGIKRPDFGLRLHHKDKSEWLLVSEGLGIGWVTPVNATPGIPSSMGRSLEFTWNAILGVRWVYGPHSVTSGLGINTRSYTLKSERSFHKNDDGQISLNEYGIGMEKRHSALRTFSLQIPLLYRLHFGYHRNFRFTLGPIINFNTGGHITTKYRLDDRDYTIKTYDINQNPVTIDIMGGMSWSGIGIYARYAPMRVLRSCTGLDFRSFSTGIMVMF